MPDGQHKRVALARFALLVGALISELAWLFQDSGKYEGLVKKYTNYRIYDMHFSGKNGFFARQLVNGTLRGEVWENLLVQLKDWEIKYDIGKYMQDGCLRYLLPDARKHGFSIFR